MKEKALFIVGIVLLSLIVPLTISDNITGDTMIPADTFISADTTWTLAGSPYILEGKVTVEENITLRIEPGVEVIFNYTADSIKCYGYIEAIGTESNRISFRGTMVYNYAGTGFVIENTGHINATYCDFSKLRGGITLYSYNYGNITNCHFSDIDYAAITIERSDNLRIMNNEFVDNGIQLWPFAQDEYRNCRIEGNTVDNRPIYYYQNQTDIVVPSDAGSVIVSNCTDVNMENMNVVGWVGINVLNSENISITNSIISNSRLSGLWISDTKNVILDSNRIENNNDLSSGAYAPGGLNLWYTDNITISNSFFANNSGGLTFNQDSNLTINDNEFYNDGLSIEGLLRENIENIIIENNHVNDKPIYAFKNMNKVNVPKDAGAVIMLNCSNSSIEGLDTSNAGYGIQLSWCEDMVINDCNVRDNEIGILFRVVSGSRIMNSTLVGNKRLISMSGSDDNVICMNDFNGKGHWITDTTYARYQGLIMDTSYNNQIFNNNFTDMGYALLIYSYNNQVYNNNFVDYYQNAAPSKEAGNRFDNGYPSGGNYWYRHAGVDLKTGANQNIPGRDGFGDAAFEIDQQYPEMIDNYPLMHPYAWWGEVSPTIELLSPNTTFIHPGDNLTFNIWDGNLDLGNIEYSTNGEEFEDMDISCIIKTDEWRGGEHIVEVIANDTTGHSTRSSYEFLIDETKPWVVSTYPADGAVDVPTTSNIIINFSEPMKEHLVNINENIRVRPIIESPFYIWNNDSTVLELDFPSYMTPGAEFSITVNDRFMDINGLNMASDHLFKFTIALSPTVDSDGDGVMDSEDAFPTDPSESLDTDGDTIGNNADPDDDNDGVIDFYDTEPLDPTITETFEEKQTRQNINVFAGLIVIIVIILVAIAVFMIIKKGKEPKTPRSEEVNQDGSIDVQDTNETGSSLPPPPPPPQP